MFGFEASWMDGPLAIAVGVLFVAVFLLPSLIAFNRDVELRWVILVINLFLGASLIGWLVALYLATRKPKSVPTPQLL
ncbi:MULTISPECIES: superinfection immunity protein [unclassified Streptomyces]|uniref:superinfection immunity protein n=1 Tax=unclassified Streptomyces TaxID=2593676 RepID=UPI00332E3A39